MKKIFVFLFCLLSLFSLATVVHAEEGDPTAKVIFGECKYGSVTTDILEGAPGDIVTIYPNPQILCKLIAIRVNGTEIVKDEAGEYKFALIEGDNIITIECEVSQEDMEVIVELIENAQKGSWEEIFSYKNIFNLISWAISLFMGSGLLVTLVRNKKIKAKTADDISAEVKTMLPEAVKDTILDKFAPIMENVEKLTKEINEACDTLVRCMMLMQENTPEARIAVSKELASLNRKGTDIKEQVIEIIRDEMAKAEEAKLEKRQAIQELEKGNEEIVDKFTTDDTIDDDLRGRI